jgi:hypothetical protein
VIGKGDPNAPQDQSGVEAVLGTADTALKNEDLASAITALKQIERSAGETVSAWIREAEARLAMENTLAALDAALARRLRESGSGSTAKP